MIPENARTAQPIIQGPSGSALLTAAHWHKLAVERGIAADLITQRGYLSARQPADLIDRTFSKAQAKYAPALLIPRWNVHGQQDGWQMRPDAPRQFKDGKVGKYEQAKGSRLMLDVHPSVQPLIGDPTVPLWITEGIPKGDALASHEACTIALQGVWGFKGTNQHGGKVILPDWEYVALNDRLVYVVYDSDIYHKPEVDRALRALYRFLRDKGACPGLVRWPEEYRTHKWGVDDFLAQGHTLDDLLAMVPPMGPLPERPPRVLSKGAVPQGHAQALPYSDYTNAQAFVQDHGANVRHCDPWNTWLVWTGTHWQQDTSGAVMRLAKQTVKRLARQLEYLEGPEAYALLNHIKASLNTGKLKALLENAQSEDGIHVQPEDLDRDPWLLNVANGTLDLRTATLRPHAREDLLTFALAVAYDPAAPCPQWQAFLTRIMADNTSLMTFLQRAIGYALTGVIREHVLLILWGTGRNGKSTFLNLLRTLLGPYAMKAPSELLMVSNNDRHPTERADLLGKRFVAAIETEQGRKLAEVFVKEATGGDPIRARRMRENFWEFQPTHKVFLATNHKPVISGTDTAIWERLKLIPFTVTIPEGERDTTLPEKLAHELPGILNWALHGCALWQQGGLGEPEEVRNATAGYRREMDSLGQFIEDSCLTGPNYRVKASDLYEAYRQWCQAQGEYPEVQRPWGMKLTERGYESGKVQGRSWWKGIALMQVDEGENPGLPVQHIENQGISHNTKRQVDEGRPENGIQQLKNSYARGNAVFSSTSSTSSTSSEPAGETSISASKNNSFPGNTPLSPGPAPDCLPVPCAHPETTREPMPDGSILVRCPTCRRVVGVISHP